MRDVFSVIDKGSNEMVASPYLPSSRRPRPRPSAPSWAKVWPVNPLEQLKRETKRSADVVQAFPQPRSLGPARPRGPD